MICDSFDHYWAFKGFFDRGDYNFDVLNSFFLKQIFWRHDMGLWCHHQNFFTWLKLNFVVIIQVQQFRTGTSYGLEFERTVERICFIGYGQKDEYLQGFCRPSKGLKFLILFMILKIYDLEIPLAIF